MALFHVLFHVPDVFGSGFKGLYIYTLIRISCHYELIPNKSIDPDSVFSAFSSSTNRPMLHGTKRRRLGACENDVNLHAENQKCGNP